MRRELTARLASTGAFFALLAFGGPTASAAPPPKGGAASAKAACLAAHEDAQSLRAQKKPHAALERFVACARVECPTVVRKECVEQVALVEKDAPTVALGATDEAGADTTAVKVSMDGTPVTERLTGSAVDVEPGEHVFKFERADGKSIEVRTLVVEGDKNRKITADFATLVPKPPPVDPATTVPHEKKKIPALAFVAGGLALAGAGSFAFFALSGKGEEKDLASSCQPNCKDDQLSPVKRDYLIADISLAVGIVAAAAAVILAWPALSDSSETAARVARRASPAPWLPSIKVRSR